MADKRNDAFSSYSSLNMKPKNITSDMWEPITTSGNYTAYTPSRQEFRASEPEKYSKANKANKAQSQKNGRVRESVKADVKKAAPEADKPKRKKSAAQANKTQRPISSGKAQSDKAKKQKKNPSAKAKAPSKLAASRAQRQRDKTNRRFLKLVNSGKSVDRAREIIIKRKIRKRKLKTLFSVMFFFFFAVIFVLSYTYFEGAPVKNIIIEGDEVYSDAEILDAAKLSEGVNMLTVREKKVNEDVVKILPFVSAVGVDYALPDTLKLNIISTTEKFIIKNGSGYICVDKTGKVVSEKKKKLSAGQYLIEGMSEQSYSVGEMFVPDSANAERYEIARQVALAADANETLNTGVINVSDTNDVTLTYKSRLRIYLGNSDRLASKLSVAQDVMTDNAAENKTGYINAKYDIAAYFMQGSMDA